MAASGVGAGPNSGDDFVPKAFGSAASPRTSGAAGPRVATCSSAAAARKMKGTGAPAPSSIGLEGADGSGVGDESPDAQSLPSDKVDRRRFCNALGAARQVDKPGGPLTTFLLRAASPAEPPPPAAGAAVAAGCCCGGVGPDGIAGGALASKSFTNLTNCSLVVALSPPRENENSQPLSWSQKARSRTCKRGHTPCLTRSSNNSRALFVSSCNKRGRSGQPFGHSRPHSSVSRRSACSRRPLPPSTRTSKSSAIARRVGVVFAQPDGASPLAAGAGWNPAAFPGGAACAGGAEAPKLAAGAAAAGRPGQAGELLSGAWKMRRAAAVADVRWLNGIGVAGHVLVESPGEGQAAGVADAEVKPHDLTGNERL
mmetsp:Transcript_93055/g.268798  ORF Transcript_93055/g.268798 Transcript_93055/m.268798 type:complete len:370 (-) Transcript_93055:275-1384(-)